MKNLRCAKCEEVKPESEFYFKNKSKGVRQGQCKSCVKEYYEENKEENKERRKKYNEEHKEQRQRYNKENKEQLRAYDKKYREEHKKQRQRYNKKNKEHIKERHKERIKARRMAAVLFIYEYFLTHHCVDCGESDPLVLEFDHVRGEKFMDVSAMVSRGYLLERIGAEIAKCEVRCRNCHTKRHAIENNTLMVQIVKETC